MCEVAANAVRAAGRSGEVFGASKPGEGDAGAVDVGKAEEKVRRLQQQLHESIAAPCVPACACS